MNQTNFSSNQRSSDPLNILTFDTSTSACAVGLLNGDEWHLVDKIAPMQQAQLLLPTIQTLLEKASLTLNDLHAIAYGCGPGSFTGIRIASSVAQGLGFARKCPIIPISSLAVMAQSAFIEHGFSQVLVMVDARMGEVYFGRYAINEQNVMTLIGEESVGTPESIVSQPRMDGTWYGIGDAWTPYQEKLIKSLSCTPKKILPTQLPKARALLQLAKAKYHQKQWVDHASFALPVYLR